ncbi:MAG: DUF3427 domain-containing protein [Candidatus Nanopelagicales bacterium]
MSDLTGNPISPGLYEEILTSRLERLLEEQLADRGQPDISALDVAEAADRLTLHVSALIEKTIESMPEATRVEQGSELIRAIGQRLQPLAPKLEVAQDLPSGRARMLRSLSRTNPDGSPARVALPEVPLLDTTLLTNARGEPSLSRAIETEIESADSVDAIIAFIRFTGIRPLLEALTRHTEQGKTLRVLTTTFTNSTEPRALEALREIGAEIRVSYDTTTTRLHAKSWIFKRHSGASTGYVGSSNLSHAGQVMGQEWNVRISGRRNPGVLKKLEAAFEGAWRNGDFRAYDTQEFAEATARGRSAAVHPGILPAIELRLEPFQEHLLEQVDASRQQGYDRNLLVAATGTGKTVMAAVDYTRLRQRLPRARLLFVAHREEILDQSRSTFRLALRDPAFGEKWVGGESPLQFEHVFASVQSLNAAGIEHIDPTHFDVVIVDEFHHAAAPSYERLLSRVSPRQLLGLTATPERADGMPILHWFGDRIAADLRLWDAIDQQRLVPFQYYGVHDGMDLRDVPWKRGIGYDITELANVYTANDAWARTVIAQTQRFVADVNSMRALGFCVSVSHARFMAHHFNQVGIRAVSVTGETPEEERRAALSDLRDGKINVVFSVDLFNEGVDVPAVDTLLMLRPTESATIFLQQLGRGLRRAEGKSVCTVVDFIGQHRREFRFDARYRALFGLSRKDLEKGVRDGFTFLPAGCDFWLDRVAQGVVLRSIRDSLPSNWRQRVAELTSLLAQGHEPRLASYLQESGLDLDDIYANGRCWSDLLAEAGRETLPGGPHETELRRAIGRLTHIDDGERLSAYERFAASPAPPAPASVAEGALLRMFVVSLAGQVLQDSSLDELTALVWRHPQVLAEIGELMPILRGRVDRLTKVLHNRSDTPLRVHARYTRREILVAMKQGAGARVPEWREGVKWAEDQGVDLFLVTLNKSSRKFSPTTQYRDYAISSDLFHWESQSTTSAGSPTGQRYQHHAARGSEVFLFARMSPEDRAFWFLGPATYMGHEGERPMAITWKLRYPLPGDLYADFAAAAVA